MASNNDWAPLPQRKNGSNKRNRENQAKIIKQLKELFGSTFETDIIISVAENCDWKLELSIDALINLSQIQISNESEVHTYDPWADKEDCPSPINNYLDEAIDYLELDQIEMREFEDQQTRTETQKVETASLCGLKVQYRPRGSSENDGGNHDDDDEISDDDADVVIEEESSDYRIETPEPDINVCHFLSAPTQTPSKITSPKQVNYMNTASPQRSPARRNNRENLSTVNLPEAAVRLESDIRHGFKILIIMRGVPGSGKSYLARAIIARTMPGSAYSNHIFSADDYFAAINRGVYVFDPSKLSDAHADCRNRAHKAMKLGWSPVIIDNTNTQAWEMQQYAVMAVEYGYIVDTLEPDTPWRRDIRELERRNCHNVSRTNIRAMLDRYEPGISGDRLLRMFKLGYSARNEPPQKRLLPALAHTEDDTGGLADVFDKMHPFVSKERRRPSKPATLDSHDKGQEFGETVDSPQNIEPNLLVGNNALDTIAKEYENLESGININPSVNNIKKTSESWIEGSSYKEENLLDLVKLGAIGCERKVVISNENEDEKLVDTIQQLEQVTNDKIDEDKIIKEEDKNRNLLPCTNLTMLQDDMQTLDVSAGETNNQSNENEEKLVIDTSKNAVTEDSKTDETANSNAQEVIVSQETSTQLDSKADENSIITSKTTDEEESFVTDMASTKSPPSSDVSKSESSSKSSSLERVSDVDISQFDLFNADTTKLSEKLTPRGFGYTTALYSTLSMIKNSFLGSEKEKSNPSQNENDNQNDSSTLDRLTDKLRNNNASENSAKSSLTSTITAVEATNDTLSQLLNSSSSNNNDENLCCEVQEIVEYSPDTSSETQEKNDDIPESYIGVELEYSADENLIRELLEASSDFQLIEEQTLIERVVSDSNEENKYNMDIEKTFVEQIKNLQVIPVSEEDENKVSKEPIDKVFGSKNTFPEKIQNAINSDLDNKNLISWRESPFPLTTEVNIETNAEIETSVETCDRSTFTEPYDLNVAYIGGTDEFKVLRTSSRSINDPNKQLIINEEVQQSGRLKLHKGTMTNNSSVFYNDGIFDMESDFIEDRSDELIKRFSHLPQACVLDIYENLCKRDFNWTLDYLDNIQHADTTIYADVDQLKEINTDQAGTPLTDSLEFPNIESFNRQRQQKSQNKKYFRIKNSSVNSELKKELESKIEFNQQSYNPHTLRVMRWKKREFDEPEVEDLINFDENAQTSPNDDSTDAQMTTAKEKKLTRLDHPAVVEDEPGTSSENSEGTNEEDEEETMELTLGYEFIRVLETEFGNPNFERPDSLFPVIQIKKSMAQELYALWIESMQRQLWIMQEHLDEIIAKDAELARSLQTEEEARASEEPEVPNLKEIMDMEMALATCRSDSKRKFKVESRKDMAFRVTKQTLRECFPNYDSEMLFQIYEAHGRNFDETVKIIKENCGGKSKMTMADVLKKRKNLIDELQKESSYQISRHNQLESEEGYDEACGFEPDDTDDYAEEEISTYDDALRAARNSRVEARRQLNLRNENNQKAAEAYRRKNPEVAAYYSDVAKLHIRKMEMANSAAASAYLAAQAHILETEDKLDLHFLHVTEAIEALDIFLDYQLEQMRKGSRKCVYIITGRGARSSKGQSKIKPAIAKKLNNRNIRFSEANPGMLKVFLRKD